MNSDAFFAFSAMRVHFRQVGMGPLRAKQPGTPGKHPASA
jgi:hypothetical protein